MQWGRDRFLSAPFSQWLRIRGQDHAPLNRLPRPHSFSVPHLHKRGDQLSCLRGAPRPSQLAVLLAWARSVPRSAVGFKPPAPHTIELDDVSAVTCERTKSILVLHSRTWTADDLVVSLGGTQLE